MAKYTLKYPGNEIDTFLDDINNLSGIIVMWSGAIDNIPNGWVLCDGNNNTPDLRNRFIVGAGEAYSIGNIGGSDNVTLTTAEIPSHTHKATTTATTGSASFSYVSERGEPAIANVGTVVTDIGSSKYGSTTVNLDMDHTHTISVTASGNGAAHENRPPYYALAYIMKL